MSVRVGSLDDLGLVEELTASFLVERHQKGSDVKPTKRSVGFYLDAAEMVASKKLRGALLLFGDSAIHLSVDAQLPWDSEFGDVAIGLFTYVSPEMRRRGISRLLRREALQRLKDLGFGAAIGSADLSNEEGLSSALGVGAVPHQTQMVIRLKEI